jgi:hypothetical protein
MVQIDKDVRRLCPDISFFSQATDFPNKTVVSGHHERLHHRVQQKGLHSQSIERKGLGVVKVT